MNSWRVYGALATCLVSEPLMDINRADGYPVEHLEYVQKTRTWFVRSLLIGGGASMVLSYGFIHDWPTPLFGLAPFVTLAFVVLLTMTPGIVDDLRVACILPYFKKHSGAGEVRGDTFLSGGAIARHCTDLDALALEAGLAPLSHFGFADDLSGAIVTWHDADQGLKTCSGLLKVLRQQPSRWKDTAAVIDDLARMEVCLQNACRLQVPFCLLLRHGSTASGHEMDVRQGYFCYGGGDD